MVREGRPSVRVTGARRGHGRGGRGEQGLRPLQDGAQGPVRLFF